MDVLDWIERAEKFRAEDLLSDFAVEIFTDQNAVDVQREQWANDGTDFRGNIIGLYSKRTEEINPRKFEGHPWTLKDSGDFWEKTYLDIEVKGKDLEFRYDSNGVNKDDLFKTIKKNGLIKKPDDIFGLAKSYQEPFIRIIEPKFVEQLNNYYDV